MSQLLLSLIVASFADVLWARHAIFFPTWGRRIAWRAQRLSAKAARKKHDFEKWMYSRVSTLAAIETRRKEARFDEKPPCHQHLKKPEVTLSAREQLILYRRTSVLKIKHTVFPSFCLCLYIFSFASCETQEKNLKCKQICMLLSCFYFPQAGWRKKPNWNFTSLATRATAHKNRLMDP